jgi:CRISPR-associated endonuclease/helicase Cas3
VTQQAPAGVFRFWAKLGPDTYHPLPCHLFDVGAVAEAMWDLVLGPSGRSWLAGCLVLSVAEARPWVSFLAGAHDLGKACPAFQVRPESAHLAAHLAAHFEGLPICRPGTKSPHGTVTAKCLQGILQERFGVSREAALTLATAVGGHHGLFPSSKDIQDAKNRAVGSGPWSEARLELCQLLAQHFELPERAPGNPGTCAATFLAGLVSVADWIASNPDFFPYAEPSVAPRDYLARSRDQARRALQALGWLDATQPQARLTFSELFPTLPGLRPLQSEVERLAGLEATPPRLVLLEAPMGEGKTEAALYLADTAAATSGLRGFYMALPTQATSNQMLERAKAFLEARYPGERVQLQLLHGHAALSAEFERLRQAANFAPAEVYGEEGATSGQVVASEWFCYRKRGLLSPFSVGTVDQALMGVLATRHVFVRLFGLAHRVVILDEVHAYDTYTSGLIDSLLEWLAALGSTAVILSATLPDRRRRELAAAFQRGLREDPTPLPSADYPRVTWISGSGPGATTLETSQTLRREVGLRWVTAGDQESGSALSGLLEEQLTDAGCAVVLCNTVGHAQTIYQTLKPRFPDVDIIHARYPFEERMARERRVLERFGKGSDRRPARSVLVATQVLEQSLDLDFDLMITQLAPVDLVLQRMGRLHRHPRSRPARLTEPTLWVLEPDLTDGVPTFDRGSSFVYLEHVLLRTWMALRDLEAIRVPEDLGALVEAVYDDGPCLNPEFQARWDATLRKAEVLRQKHEEEIRMRSLLPPSFDGLLWRLTDSAREEDAPELHQAHQALTRLAEPSVGVICLGGLDETAPVRDLLNRSVTLTHRGLVQRLLERKPPPAWKRSPILRHYRPLEFVNGEARAEGYIVRMDPELGLTIEKEES